MINWRGEKNGSDQTVLVAIPRKLDTNLDVDDWILLLIARVITIQ